jgi:small conductance mechanosensitive channel
MKWNNLLLNLWNWLRHSGYQIILILVITFVALRLSRFLSKKLMTLVPKHKMDVERKKRADTLSSIIQWVINILIITMAAMMLLDHLGIQVGPILAAAGVLGLAVGFGAQSLVKDVISGFFILLEDQIRVGDVVEAAGKSGLVERVNLRMTILRDLAGNVHFIPNGEIDVVTNMTKGYSRYVFEIGVAYRENVDEVMEIMRQVDEDLREDPDFKNDITEPLEILGLDQFADSALVIKARTTTKPIKQWRVAREFNRRLKIRFDEKDIEIPFPHITLYMGKDKANESPPMNIVMENPKSR